MTQELFEVRERLHVSLLHDVLYLCLVAENGAYRSVNALVVASHEKLEQRGITRPNTSDQFLIADVSFQSQSGSRRGCLHSLLLMSYLPLNGVTGREKVPDRWLSTLVKSREPKPELRLNGSRRKT
jgi:hypothetical protein